MIYLFILIRFHWIPVISEYHFEINCCVWLINHPWYYFITTEWLVYLRKTKQGIRSRTFISISLKCLVQWASAVTSFATNYVTEEDLSFVYALFTCTSLFVRLWNAVPYEVSLIFSYILCANRCSLFRVWKEGNVCVHYVSFITQSFWCMYAVLYEF